MSRPPPPLPLTTSGDCRLCDAWSTLGPAPHALNRANNCYAYAVGTLESLRDIKARGHEDATPQPGDASGIPKNILLLLYHRSLPFWIRLAERDGLRALSVKQQDPLPSLPASRRLVALTYHPQEEDYHWLRRESNGLWTHKPDSRRPPTWYDSQRQPISDPRLATIENYSGPFVFFSLPAHGVDVRMSKEWRTFLNRLEDVANGQQEALRPHLRKLAGKVRPVLAVFADYLEEVAHHGSSNELKHFWTAMREGKRLEQADGLLPFHKGYPHLPPRLLWALHAKANPAKAETGTAVRKGNKPDG